MDLGCLEKQKHSRSSNILLSLLYTYIHVFFFRKTLELVLPILLTLKKLFDNEACLAILRNRVGDDHIFEHLL